MEKSYWRETLKVRAFGLAKVPLIFFVGPKVISIDENHVEIKIPLNRRTKNHLNSMYFGTQAVGADLAAGFLTLWLLDKKNIKALPVFKDFKANFLKRAEGDMHFICRDGEEIIKHLQEVDKTGERVNFPLKIIGTVPEVSGDEVVSEFDLTMSLKKRS